MAFQINQFSIYYNFFSGLLLYETALLYKSKNNWQTTNNPTFVSYSILTLIHCRRSCKSYPSRLDEVVKMFASLDFFPLGFLIHLGFQFFLRPFAFSRPSCAVDLFSLLIVIRISFVLIVVCINNTRTKYHTYQFQKYNYQ